MATPQPTPRKEHPPTTPIRLPWERGNHETDLEWDAFRRYRDLGPTRRSLARVASDLIGDPAAERRTKPEAFKRRLEQWSSRYQWRERVEAWDRELDRRKRDEMIDEVLQMARRHAELSQAMMTTIAQPAIEFLKRLRDDPRRLDQFNDRELLSLTVAAGRVMPAVAQMERSARGLGTERGEVSSPSAAAVERDYVMSEEHMIGLFAAMAEVGYVPKPPELPNGSVVDVPNGDAS